MTRPSPSVQLTSASRDPAVAAGRFSRFEGVGLDGILAKRLEGVYQPGRRPAVPRRHLQLQQDRTGWPGDRDGPAAGPRSRGPPLGGVGRRRGPSCCRGGGPAAPARRDQSLEPRPGPLLGATPGRARLRGRLRSPARRPLPARHQVPALAGGSLAPRVPLRSAGGHSALRARPHLWLTLRWCRVGRFREGTWCRAGVAVGRDWVRWVGRRAGMPPVRRFQPGPPGHDRGWPAELGGSGSSARTPGGLGCWRSFAIAAGERWGRGDRIGSRWQRFVTKRARRRHPAGQQADCARRGCIDWVH